MYHSALEVSPAERAAFLYDFCGEDKEMLGEVESLPAFETVSEQFFDYTVDFDCRNSLSIDKWIVYRLTKITTEKSNDSGVVILVKRKSYLC